MTDKQKIQMVQLKAKGYGYRKIASELNLSENTVKSFLKRNTDTCLNCGSNVVGKKYCSDKCRMIWWRNHPHRTTSMMECKCKVCGKVFYAYPSKERKYCSRKCYGKSCRKDISNEKRKATANCRI